MPKYLIFLLAGFLLACDSGPRLPETRPADFRVEYFEGGGMLPESQQVTIRPDSTVDIIFLNGKKTRTVVANSAGELDDFYQKLRELRVLRIRSRDEGEVYDRGGTSVWLSWGEKSQQISDSGNLFVEEKFQADYAAMLKLILDYNAKVQAGLKKKYHLAVRNGSPESPVTQLHVFVDRISAILRIPDSATIDTAQVDLHLIPGRYQVQVSGNRIGGSFWEQQSVTFREDMSGLDIVLYQDSVVLKQINP
ncbi:MAG: hypothetical protein H6581_06835 [Bacteroidia bacterium]|nr:hypothetical protein [Bacteroidia bacterium]